VTTLEQIEKQGEELLAFLSEQGVSGETYSRLEYLVRRTTPKKLQDALIKKWLVQLHGDHDMAPSQQDRQRVLEQAIKFGRDTASLFPNKTDNSQLGDWERMASLDDGLGANSVKRFKMLQELFKSIRAYF